MVSATKKAILAGFILSLLAALGIIIAVAFGSKNIPLSTVIDSIFNYEDVLDMQVVRNGRIPRALAAILIGGFLGISGAMMQGVTRNPIAEPSLMGITQGATFAVALVSINPDFYAMTENTFAALAGSATSGGLVLLFSMQNPRNMSISRFVLAGTALGTFFISLASTLSILSNRTQELAFWVAGGLRSATWDSVAMLAAAGGLCSLAALFISGRINIVNLGEDMAISLGERPGVVRFMAMILIIIICSVSVSVAGNIAFIGLIVPHIVRSFVGENYKLIMPLSFLGGSVLLIWADNAARLLNRPYETPVGLFTSLIGVPIFIWMVRRNS
jgi:iron complex transport system permease protein